MAEQNYGLIRQDTGRAEFLPIPVPQLPDDYILVRTVAVALNPTDWTTLDAKGDNGTLVGCDYAGVVEAVGKAVRKDWKKGDRVAGFGHGGNDQRPETGSFARFIIAKGDVQLRIPDDVSFEAAATFGVGVVTAGFGLYKVLGLPYPQSPASSDGRTLLIYGGSTATGTLAIQLAKLTGLHVVTTCSPKNAQLVEDRGADVVLDYRAPNVGKRIREATNDELSLVFDTVSIDETAAISAAAFGAKGGQYANLLGPPCPRPDVASTFFLVYDVSGEEYIFEGEGYPANPAAFEFAADFVPIAEALWREGKIRPHPQRVEPRGLHGALEGLDILRQGLYSGEKLVYRVEETVWPQ